MKTITQTPQLFLNELADRADRIETSFSSGKMVWHRWPSDRPTRPPIILLHGGFGSWTHWARVITELQKSVTVIAADLPGLGDSSDAPLPHTAEKLAAITKQGIDQILAPGELYHLAGFSFGGMLGSLIAAASADQCLTFTAVGASGFGDLHYIVEGIELPSDDMPEQTINDIHRKNLQLLMFSDNETVDDLSLYIHRSNVARGRIRSRRLSVSDTLLKTLPDIKAKIGGIWGAFDSTGGGLEQIKTRAQIFRRYRPDAPFDIIDDAGHWVMYEQPEAFNASLLRQLDYS